MTTTEEQTSNALRYAEAVIESNGFSRASFARHLGVPVSTLLGWFARRTISLTTLVTMANAVGRRPSVLLLSDDERAMLAKVLGYLEASGAQEMAEEMSKYLKGS